jgi:hypothetical protein
MPILWIYLQTECPLNSSIMVLDRVMSLNMDANLFTVL